MCVGALRGAIACGHAPHRAAGRLGTRRNGHAGRPECAASRSTPARSLNGCCNASVSLFLFTDYSKQRGHSQKEMERRGRAEAAAAGERASASDKPPPLPLM
ncbi:hypothetical protein M885DRAFT_517636 [Pelagophyceae sp. CCMP2097]|nr:hypothetical protein M885DRAFT_517636 [Pelagophyceae sp. CCMP2097]